MGRLILIMLFFVSCNGQVEHNHNIEGKVKEEGISKRQPVQGISKINKWVQFKKVPVIDQNDTLPYVDCYIEIEGNLYRYFREGKLIEEDTVTINRDYEFKVFSFVKNQEDLIQFLDKKDSIIVLKRNYFDGIQEYFFKSK